MSSSSIYSYGQSGGSTLEIRKEMVKLNQHLMKDKLDYAWIDSASKEYSKAITRLLFMSSIHSSVLDVHSLRKEMEPSGEVEFWCNAVLETEDHGLIQALETINQIVQGLNTFQATSILGVFKENAMPTSTSTVCQQVHAFRDYLMDIQIQGYALVSTCLNYNGSLAIDPLVELGLKRLKQQEEILGGRFNDWYAYGKASCSYQIQQFGRQDHCIKVSSDDTVELFNDYSLVELKECDRNRPAEDTQWIYNKVSWQIVPRNNQSLCLQKLFNGYNAGIPIVLKQCQQYQVLHAVRKVKFCPKIQFWQNPNIFTSFSPKKIDNFLGKSKLNFWTV